MVTPSPLSFTTEMASLNYVQPLNLRSGDSAGGLGFPLGSFSPLQAQSHASLQWSESDLELMGDWG